MDKVIFLRQGNPDPYPDLEVSEGPVQVKIGEIEYTVTTKVREFSSLQRIGWVFYNALLMLVTFGWALASPVVKERFSHIFQGKQVYKIYTSSFEAAPRVRFPKVKSPLFEVPLDVKRATFEINAPFALKSGTPEEMAALKAISTTQMKNLWNAWDAVRNNHSDWFIKALDDKMQKFFANICRDGENFETVLVTPEFFDRDSSTGIYRDLEDTYSTEYLTDPYKLACGHRYNDDSLKDLNNQCCSGCPNSKVQPEFNLLLGEFVKLLVAIKI